MLKMIDMIKDPIIKEAIENLLNKDDIDALKAEYAEEVAYWSYKLLEEKHLISNGTQQAFVDLIISAALIHNLFVNEEDKINAPYQVFEARKNLTEYFNEHKLTSEFSNYIFTIIESQFGEDSPIPCVRPNRDTPQAIIAEAKFIVDHLEEYDRWFMHRFYPEIAEAEDAEEKELNDAVAEH
jgi:hypothetical protein